MLLKEFLTYATYLYTIPSSELRAKHFMTPYSCKLPNVDPATGIRHKVEPDNSLRKYRAIDGGAPGRGCFGMQLCPIFSSTDKPEDMELSLEVGMEIKVLERGQHWAL